MGGLSVRIAVLVTLLSGCGRIGYTFGAPFDGGDNSPSDAAGEDDRGMDAPPGDGGRPDALTVDTDAPDAPIADVPDIDTGVDDAGLLGPFEEPQPIGPLAHPAADDDPTLTEDLLEMYFASERPGGLGPASIWVSVRGDPSAPWEPPILAPNLNSSSTESNCEISRDGLSIWFGSDRVGGVGGRDIWVSIRPLRSEPWEAPVRVPELSSTDDDDPSTPSLSPPIMLINSTRTGGLGDWDFYESTNSSGTWSPPTLVTALSTGGYEGEANLSPDGLTVYFDSTRPGPTGSRDIYVSTRPNLDSEFTTPVPVAEVNTADAESDPWVSPDGRYMAFSRVVGGNRDLYEALR